MNVEVLQTDQKKKTPVSNGPKTAPYFFRFGLDRSRDTQKSDQSSQDCISIQWTATRLSATLCDGVSQSFFGELAAAELSNKLSQFLLALPIESDAAFLHDTIRAFLDNLSSTFSRTVEEYSLDNIEPAFLRSVLEKKRYLGSEAVFTSVLLDKTTNLTLLVWAGDCRLRLWLRDEEVTKELLSTETFLTQERWSSSKGIIGDLHLALFPVSSFDTIMSYSDGLSLLDEKSHVFQESNIAIEHYVSQTKSFASSDDVSFLQISTLPSEKLPLGSTAQLPELRVTEGHASDFVHLQWQNSALVQSWEVVANSETGFAKLTASKNIVKVPKTEIASEGAWLAYRGKTNGGFTPWSSWKFYQPPRSAQQIETEKSKQNAILSRTQPPLKAYRQLPQINGTTSSGAGSYRAPSFSGASNHYPERPQTQQVPPVSAPSDRTWQFALLALLVGIFILGSFMIFGGKGEEPEVPLAVPQIHRPSNVPSFNPPIKDTPAAAETQPTDAAFENADTETPATDSAGENADTETPATDTTKENEATEAPATDSDEATDMTETITHSVTGETDDSGTKCHLGIKPINVFDLQRTLFSRPIIMRSEICLFPE